MATLRSKAIGVLSLVGLGGVGYFAYAGIGLTLGGAIGLTLGLAVGGGLLFGMVKMIKIILVKEPYVPIGGRERFNYEFKEPLLGKENPTLELPNEKREVIQPSHTQASSHSGDGK